MTAQRGLPEQASSLCRERRGRIMLYVVDNHAVASLRYYIPAPKYSPIDYIYVNLVHTPQEHRGRGYANSIVLEVLADNVPAISLYHKLGFKTMAHHEDELVMVRPRREV